MESWTSHAVVFCMMSVSSLYQSSCPFIAEFHYMYSIYAYSYEYTTICLPVPDNGRLSSFYFGFLWIKNTMNILGFLFLFCFVWTFVFSSLGRISRCRIYGNKGIFMYIYVEMCKKLSNQHGYDIFPLKCVRDLVVPHLHQDWALSDFIILAMLLGAVVSQSSFNVYFPDS